MRQRWWPAFASMHWWSLALLAAVLPWSTALVSNAELLLALNWLAWGISDRSIGTRFRKVFTDRWSLLFLSFFGLHVLGLLWTEDMAWGTDLVRILLPIPILCIILSGSPQLERPHFNWIMRAGAWSAVLSSAVCLIIGWDEVQQGDHRDVSFFISHVRLGLLLVLAIAVFLLIRPKRNAWWYAQLAGAAWAVCFLAFSGGMSGVIAGVALGSVFVWHWAGGTVPQVRWTIRIVILMIPVIVVGVLVRYMMLPIERTSLSADMFDQVSAGGEIYYHDLEDPQFENGHYVYVEVAEMELSRAWKRRSSLPYTGTDERGQPLNSTLFRYMASMGLSKDSVGLRSLSDEDIRRVEQGLPSVRTGRRAMLISRLEQLRMELDQYRISGDPNGHSLTMRFEYWRIGWGIARDNLVFGVGTGDTVPAFAQAYEAGESTLLPQWRHRAHDQYLTLLISFGIFGLLWSLYTWIRPAVALGAHHSLLFISWATIFAVSCLTEDTLETQTGATFFALYYCLMVFGVRHERPAGKAEAQAE